MKLMLAREIALMGLAVSPFVVQAAQACDPAVSASYAGDGNTQFGDGGLNFPNEGASGKLKFGVTYKAVAENSQQRTNCKWHIYSIDAKGKIVYQSPNKDYSTARINVEQPARTKVYLKSVNCGLWKPEAKKKK